MKRPAAVSWQPAVEDVELLDARTISPVHTSNDGDAVFVMATGEVEADADALGVLASEVMARAINRAAWQAESAYGYKAAGDL